MSDFGLVMLFRKYLISQGYPRQYVKAEKAMRHVEKHEPGEWFKFLAWAALQKANRQQEK